MASIDPVSGTHFPADFYSLNCYLTLSLGSVAMGLNIYLLVRYIRRLYQKRDALIMFSLIFGALAALLISGGISWALVRKSKCRKLSWPHGTCDVQSAEKCCKYFFVVLELAFLAYVFGFIAFYLFFYKYWRLSLKLEVAARISALDVQGSKIWQSLLFIFPILVGAAATAWLVFDEMRSRIFKGRQSKTYNQALGIFLTAFPSYFLLAIQIDVIRRLKRVEKQLCFLSVKTSNVALLSSLLILFTLSFLGLQIFCGQDYWAWTVIIIVVQVGMCVFVVQMIKFVRQQLEFQLEDETKMTFDAQTCLDTEDQEQNPYRALSFPDPYGFLRSTSDVNVMRFATEISDKKLEFSTRDTVNEETDNPMAHSLTSIN